MKKDKTRCPWPGTDKAYIKYHDTEWGVPVIEDDRTLFEFLVLEGAQAGLSWLTILKKREAYRKAFDDFYPEKVAGFGKSRIHELSTNTGIVRNIRKIESAVNNASVFIKIQEEYGSFGSYFWRFTEGQIVTNRWETMDQVPALTPLSEKISKDMKKRGFSFVGPTIIYSMMQAVGMVNDHLVSCFRHSECVMRGNVQPK